MPTASEQAAAEQERWADLARRWSSVPISEEDVIVFFDPTKDIERRTARWGHRPRGSSLTDLAMFAAGLASAEAEAWHNQVPETATSAYEERRLLVGDRIIHWAVPWLEAEGGRVDQEFLLGLGDEMRVAPRLTGKEGIRPSGEDSYGPLALDVPLDDWVGSLLSGTVVKGDSDDLSEIYHGAVSRWESLAREHPGSAELWHDLAARAAATAARLTRNGSRRQPG